MAVKPSTRGLVVGENDLKHKNAPLAAEWHPTKNLGVTPDQVLSTTEQKAWWLCQSGHEWEANVRNRSVVGAGCPFCSGRRVSVGENDLATTHPELASEWHPTKNGSILPSEVSAGMGKKYWWQCSNGHEWDQTLNHRSRLGAGCPVCSNRRIVLGVNDFATRFPEHKEKWHPTKNGTTEFSSLSLGRPKMYWWLCDEGHAYKSSPMNLVKGRRCGVCANRQVELGVNDLTTTHPQIASQWDYEKNGGLYPTQVIATSSRPLWWRCNVGHSWRATGEARVASSGCPICGNKTRTPVVGQNDLATTHPEIARMWHISKNGSITPEMVFAGAREARWWTCEKGHEFRATGSSLAEGAGCGVCANRQVQVGINDMASTHPELARQWHPVKNLPLTPESVIGSHSGQLWWICDSGHEFVSRGQKRASGTGCPVCQNQKLLTGYNDLETVNPDLAEDWHPTKNGELVPSLVICGGHRKYWWICKEGHEWRTEITGRLAGTGCPSCAKSGFDPTKPGVLYFIFNRDYRAFKVGITNVGTTRLERFVKSGWTVMHTYQSRDGEEIRMIETEVFRWIRKGLKLPRYLGREEMGALGGYSETFSAEDLEPEAVISKVNSILGNSTNESF